MDRPSLPKQADRPSDEGLMTLSRGLDPARLASSSSAPASPSAASMARGSSADGFMLGRAANSVEPGSSQDARRSNGAASTTMADRQDSSASAPAMGASHGSSTANATAAAAVGSSPVSSSYQRRMPLSPLSRSLIDDPSDAEGRGTTFVRSPPSSTSPSSSTSPPTTKARPGPTVGFASHDRSSTRASRPMALPAPPPPPASQNRAAGGQTPLKSPCFVHGNLGHSVTLQDWLERRSQTTASGSGAVKDESAEVLRAAASTAGGEPTGNNDDDGQRPSPSGKAKGPAGTIAEEDEDGRNGAAAGSGYDTDGPEGESLTRQLAETAVGVREMSKQLGMSWGLNLRILPPPSAGSLTKLLWTSLQVERVSGRISRASSSSRKRATTG